MAKIITTAARSTVRTPQAVTSSKIVTSASVPSPTLPAAPTAPAASPQPLQTTASGSGLVGPINLSGPDVLGQLPLASLGGEGARIGDTIRWNGVAWTPVYGSLSTQTTWWIDPVAGDDTNDGLTQATAVRTLAEFVRRTTPTLTDAMVITNDTDVYFAAYPPVTDPLRLRVKFFQKSSGVGPTLTFHPPPLSQSSSGTLSAVTTLNRATNTPWEVTDGVVVTTGDVKKRIRITGGPNTGARAWIALSTGAGRRRTSTFGDWAATNAGPTVVTPLVNDPYVLESSTGFLYLDFIEVLPGGGAPFPSMATFNIDGFDFRPIVDGATTTIINAGCALDFANCAFWGGEWYVRTRVPEGDGASSFTIFENCAAFDGENNLMFCEGTFIDNYVWGGLFGGALWARQGGQFTVDFDTLGQGNVLGGVPGLFCNIGSAIDVMSMGIMDMNANFGAVIVSDGVIGCRNDFSFSGNFGLWGTSANAGAYGVNIRSGSNFRYMSGFPITITGAGGDFKLASATQARGWDDLAGAYTAKANCTWANLFGGSLKDNAHDIPSDTHIYLNVGGNAQP